MLRKIQHVASAISCNVLLRWDIRTTKLPCFVIVAIRSKGTYYDALDIPKTASGKEIKASFYRKSMKVHPDKLLTTCDTEEFIKIKTAYEVLSNYVTRKEYDEYLASLDSQYSFSEWRLRRNTVHHEGFSANQYQTIHDTMKHKGVETTWKDFGFSDLMVLMAFISLIAYIFYDQRRIVKEGADDRVFGSAIRSLTAPISVRYMHVKEENKVQHWRKKNEIRSSDKKMDKQDPTDATDPIDVFSEIKTNGVVSDKALASFSGKYKHPLETSSQADKIRSW